MIKEKQMVFKISWFDDQKRVFESARSIKSEFKETFKCDLVFDTFDEYDIFFAHIENNKSDIDLIFLDIDLGDLNFDGLYVYEEIRKIAPNKKIIFVSGQLAHPDWRRNIEELKKIDSNVDTIKLSIPLRSARHEYYNAVSSPIVKSISSKTKSFKFPYYEYLKQEKEKRISSLKRLNLFNEPFVEVFFHDNKDLDWIIIGCEPEKVLKTGIKGSILTANDLIEVSEKDGVIVCGYQRKGESFLNSIENPMTETYLTQRRLISIENISSKVLYIEENRVILKCLINEEPKKFQLREFDIEFLEGSVNLKENNIIEICIITHVGKITHLFENGDNKLVSKFDKPADIDPNKYGFEFKPLPPRNEDNF